MISIWVMCTVCDECSTSEWMISIWVMCSVIAPRVNEWYLYESCVVWLLPSEWMISIWVMCSVIAPRVNEWYLYESCVVWLLHEWMNDIYMSHVCVSVNWWVMWVNEMISIWVMCSVIAPRLNAPRVNEWYLYESCVVWLLHEWMNDIYMSHV